LAITEIFTSTNMTFDLQSRH